MIRQIAETYIRSIDQGTTGTRFMVFDHAGKVVVNTYKKHEQRYPDPGWVEHDPVEIWENTKEVVTAALGGAYAAGLAVGYWDTVDELRENWRFEKTFHPEQAPRIADELYERWGDAVERSLDWTQQ